MPAPRRQLLRRPPVAPMVRPASPHRDRGLELLQEGRTAAEVAGELGVPLTTVKGWARSLGLRRPGQRGHDRQPRAHGPHPRPRGRALWVIDLLLQGESAFSPGRQPKSAIAEIAAALGMSRQAVHRVRDRWLSDGPG